jgi:hypothetical protein
VAVGGGGREDVEAAEAGTAGAPQSGQYQNRRTRTEVTVTRSEPMPPTPKSVDTHRIVDPTKHKK